MFLIKNFRLVLVLLGLMACIALSFAQDEEAPADAGAAAAPGDPTTTPNGTAPGGGMTTGKMTPKPMATTAGQMMVGPAALLVLLAVPGIQLYARKLSPTSA